MRYLKNPFNDWMTRGLPSDASKVPLPGEPPTRPAGDAVHAESRRAEHARSRRAVLVPSLLAGVVIASLPAAAVSSGGYDSAKQGCSSRADASAHPKHTEDGCYSA